LSRIELPNGGLVYDLTASPMTSGSYDHTDEPNHHRIDGSMVGVRNYAALSFSGPRKERQCEIAIRDSEGELIWTYTLQAKDWSQANQSSSVSK
jgi:alkaline phosphatase D